MATVDYGKKQRTASRLIAKFGTAGAIRRTVIVDDTPWIPGSGTTTITDHACTLVVTEYSVFERTQTLIEATDRKVLISTEGLSVTPTPADQLVIGGAVHSIIHVKPLEPADVVLLWEVQARA